MAPENLTATVNGAGSLNISWSLANTIEGVAVEYDLVATNLKDSSQTMVLIREDQHHILTSADSASCDVYLFQVTAGNRAGSSSPSGNITISFPTLPDISPVEDSLHHSLLKTANGVVLNVTFNVSTMQLVK